MELNENSQKLLSALREQASKTPPFLFVTVAAAAELVAAGVAEQNKDMPNPKKAGQFATRALPEKKDEMESNTTTTTGTETDAATGEATAAAAGNGSGGNIDAMYPIDTDVPEPVKPKRAPPVKKDEDTYGLARLEVGQALYVAATEKVPAPWKTLRGAVERFQARYGKETGETKTERQYTYKRDEAGNFVTNAEGVKVREHFDATVPVIAYEREFSIFQAAENDPRGPNGARIKRTK